MTDTPPPPPPPPGFSTTPPAPPVAAAPPQGGYAVPPQGNVYAAPPAGYAPTGYAAPPPAVYADPTAAKNWMNIVSLIASISSPITGFGAIVGIIFGHLGLGAVKRGEANNRGMGLAGLIIGYILVAIGVLGFIAYLGLFVWAASSSSTSP